MLQLCSPISIHFSHFTHRTSRARTHSRERQTRVIVTRERHFQRGIVETAQNASAVFKVRWLSSVLSEPARTSACLMKPIHNKHEQRKTSRLSRFLRGEETRELISLNVEEAICQRECTDDAIDATFGFEYHHSRKLSQL